MRIYLAIVLMALSGMGSVFAEDEYEADGDERWREFCNLTAENIVMWPIGKDGKGDLTSSDAKPFVRHPKPIFEHKNPFNRDERGLVYLWKQENGRPVAIFTSLVFKKTATNRWNEVIEHHTLHDDRLVTTYGSSKDVESYDRYATSHVWKPNVGIKWKPVPDGPKPANSKARLNLQGRSLIRRFSCDGIFPSGQTYHLNAQTTPVYKYDLKEDGKQLGGLVTFFCRATDPEAILALDVRENSEGELEWNYALGNFTIGNIVFFLDKKKIWEESSGQAWFQSNSKHYGGFPFQGFTIPEGIKRQQSYQSAK